MGVAHHPLNADPLNADDACGCKRAYLEIKNKKGGTPNKFWGQI